MKHNKQVRQKIKVLPLPYYLDCNIDLDNDVLYEELQEDYTQIPTVFNRNGLYMQGTLCWLEFNGKAYTGFVDSSYFDYKINCADENILRTVELEALEKVFNTTSDSSLLKAIQKRLCRHYRAFDNRDSYRMARKNMLRFIKENPDDTGT